MSQATRTGSGIATGTRCTISVQGPGSGSSIIGTVSVVNSPSNARWTLTNAGTDVTTIVGSSSYGPIVITGTLPLTLTSTGPTLVNGTAYRATIVGVIPRGAVTLRTLIPQPAPMAVTEITLKGGTIDIGKVAKVTVIESIKAGNVTSLVANQTGTVLQTGDAQDFLYSGLGHTTGGTPTALTLYGLTTSSSTIGVLSATAPSTSVSTDGANYSYPHTNGVKSVSTTGVPIASTTYRGLTPYEAKYTHTLSGNAFIAGKWQWHYYIKNTASNSITITKVRLTIYAGTNFVGRLTSGAIGTVLAPGGVITGTLAGTLGASVTFSSSTRLTVQQTVTVSTPASTPSGTIDVKLVSGHGATRSKLVTPGYRAPVAVATWTLTIPNTNINKAYSSLVILAITNTVRPYSVSVRDKKLQTSHGIAPRFAAAFQEYPGTSTGKYWQAIVPCGNEPGDQFTVKVYFPSVATGTLIIYGDTGNAPKPRSDGRTYPIGSHFARAASNTAGTTTVIAAPASPLRILLSSLQLMPPLSVAAAESTVLYTTINGSRRTLLTMYSTTGAIPIPPPVPIPAGGLLLDAGEALKMGDGAATTGYWTVTASYDLVP